MTSPMANQISKRCQVDHGSEIIRYRAESAPIGAVNQMTGALKGRGKLGSRTRNTRMPIDTMTKAARVPIATKLPASRTVSRAETIATPMPVTIEVIQGVLNLGCTLATTGGSKPSLDMVQNTRD